MTGARYAAATLEHQRLRLLTRQGLVPGKDCGMLVQRMASQDGKAYYESE
jgi:hypothetical protein